MEGLQHVVGEGYLRLLKFRIYSSIWCLYCVDRRNIEIEFCIVVFQLTLDKHVCA
jgi:hypothetical protein